MKEILKLEDIKLRYHSLLGETLAIDNVSFSVNQGEFVAIIGPSGSGKTTLLSIIAGLIKPSKGSVYLQNEKVESPNEKIGYMLQKDELFPWLTIYENTILPLKIKGKLNEQSKNYCVNLLKKYGLEDSIKKYPRELSGGMRQRSALIRTLSFSPKILLLDEPFSALDYQTRLDVCNDVYSIIKKENKTAILVTHDISEAISMADKIIVLSKRPSKIYNIHNINLDKNLTPLKRREDKNFGKLFELLWRELNENK